MGNVADVLSQKTSEKRSAHVYTISPTATVIAATKLMNRHKIGALVVVAPDGNFDNTDENAPCDRVVGMFTERDVLTRVVGEQRDPAQTFVEEVMTSEVAFCRPHSTLDEVGGVMRERHIRHLPVCGGGGELLGLVSIGDLNAWNARGQEVTIQYLHEYIHGRV